MYRPKCIINVASAFHNVGFNSGYKFPATSLYLRFRSFFSSFFRVVFARNFNSFCHFIGCTMTNGMSQTAMIAFNCSKFAIIFCIRYNLPIFTPSAPGVTSSGRTLNFSKKTIGGIAVDDLKFCSSQSCGTLGNTTGQGVYLLNRDGTEKRRINGLSQSVAVCTDTLQQLQGICRPVRCGICRAAAVLSNDNRQILVVGA